MNIDQSFKAYKRDHLKVIYRINLDNKNFYHERHIIYKILKLDESNQYGFAMAKPIPKNCIKEQPTPSWFSFNVFLETVNFHNKIGHLFAVDTEFTRKEQLNKSACKMRFYRQLSKCRKFLK